MSALPRAGCEPDPFVFKLRPDGHGSWLVEGPCNGCGGIFVSREAALEFVRAERRAMEEMSRHVFSTLSADRLGAQAGAGARPVPG